jgi:hypothetical protein
MGAMYGGRPFPLRKGDSLTTSLTVVEHLAKHLARQVLLRGSSVKDDGSGNGRALWTPESIAQLAGTYVRKIGTIDKPAELTKEQVMMQNVETISASDIVDEPLTTGYKDKKEVIAELEKRGIAFDARATKATLEKLLG